MGEKERFKNIVSKLIHDFEEYCREVDTEESPRFVYGIISSFLMTFICRVYLLNKNNIEEVRRDIHVICESIKKHSVSIDFAIEYNNSLKETMH